MELLIATWTMRVAIVAALAVGFVSYQAGTAVLDCVDRALVIAVAFLFAGRFLIGWLEPPERKLLRMRADRARKRTKKRRPAVPALPDSVGSRSTSTISRTA